MDEPKLDEMIALLNVVLHFGQLHLQASHEIHLLLTSTSRHVQRWTCNRNDNISLIMCKVA